MLRLIMKQSHNEELDKDFVNFYIELENGARIKVRNVFKDDFIKLRLIAEKVDE